MVAEESKSVIIESKTGLSINGVRNGKWVLTSGIILCFPECESVFQIISSSSRYATASLTLCLNRTSNCHESCIKYTPFSCESIRLNSNELVEIEFIFFSDILFKTLIDNSFDSFLDSKTFTSKLDSQILLQLCSTFVLMKVKGCFEKEENVGVYHSLLGFLTCTDNSSIRKGMEVLVEYAPFVRRSFLNSWTSGIVSQVYGQDNCLFVTDVHLIAHCGGAPVFRFSNGHKSSLMGMVLEPKMWNNGVWTGNSLAINLHAVLEHFLALMKEVPVRNFSAHGKFTEKTWFDDIDNSIVRVERQATFGSGVVLNSILGVVITCAHVVNYSTGCDVIVKCNEEGSSGTVVYSSKQGDVFDLAVIVTKSPLNNWKQLEISKQLPVKGETVYCAGFNWPNARKMIVSKGIVSAVVHHNNKPIMITTDCCIQPGCSGGAVIRTNGQLLGIPVMNLSYSNETSPHSHYNCAVPILFLADAIEQFCKTGDGGILRSYGAVRRAIKVGNSNWQLRIADVRQSEIELHRDPANYIFRLGEMLLVMDWLDSRVEQNFLF